MFKKTGLQEKYGLAKLKKKILYVCAIKYKEYFK